MKNRKTNRILWVCLSLFYGMAWGQTTGELYNTPNVQGVMNVVRYSPTENAYVNASLDPGLGFNLSLMDLNNIVDLFFSDSYEVRDMEIVDDTVFFCGRDLVNTSGFIGWFSIQELFHTIPTGAIHIDNSLSVLGLQTLDNIEVYRDQGRKLHVAGYGFHNIGAYTYKAFEAVGSPATVMQYRVADLYSCDINSQIRDMAVTDHFVVYLQCDRNQLCYPYYGIGIDFEVFPRYDMFMAPTFSLGEFQTIDVHYEHINGCPYVLRDNSDPHDLEAKMVHVGGDVVAVCSYREDIKYINSLFPQYPDCVDCPPHEIKTKYLVHRLYDITPLLTNNLVVMTSALEAPLPGGVSDIVDFVYDKQKGQYVVLHELETSPGVWERAFTTIDFSSGTPTYITADYQTTASTATVWRPESLCLSGGGGYFVSGFEIVPHTHYCWKSHVNSVDGNCDVHIQYPMVAIPTMEAKSDPAPMNASSWLPLAFGEISSPVRILPMPMKCN